MSSVKNFDGFEYNQKQTKLSMINSESFGIVTSKVKYSIASY